MMAVVINRPNIVKIKSSSNNPRQNKAIPSAGTKLDIGIGRGRDRKAAERAMASPQMIWLARLFTHGC